VFDQCVCVVYRGLLCISGISNEEVLRLTDQPPLTHITRTTRLKFFGHIARADLSTDHSPALGAVWPLCQGTGTPSEVFDILAIYESDYRYYYYFLGTSTKLQA